MPVSNNAAVGQCSPFAWRYLLGLLCFALHTTQADAFHATEYVYIYLVSVPTDERVETRFELVAI